MEGLNFLENYGCTNVIIESDNVESIQACNGIIEVWSPYAGIMAECFLKASMLGSVSFKHYLRDANKVAHELAKFAYEKKESRVWGDPPSFIPPFLVKDVTLL